MEEAAAEAILTLIFRIELKMIVCMIENMPLAGVFIA